MAQQRRTIKKSNSAPSHPVEEEKKGKRPSHPVQEEEHKERPKMPISTKREIIFILLLSVSFLLILGIYGTNLLVDDPESSVGSITGSSIIGHLGVITKWVVTGLFGVIAYIIPILCFAAGIYIIRNKDSEKSKSSIYISGFIFTVCLSALFYIFQYSVNDAEFDFMKIWKFGTLNFGGGIIGSFMGFPLVFLAKQVGASIITIAVMLMSFIAMTDFIITKRIAALVRKAKLSGANKAKAEEDGENIPVVTSGENPALVEKKRKSRSFDVADDIVPKDEPDYTSLIDEVEKLPKTGEKPASDVTQDADIFKFTPKEKEIPAFVPPAEKVQPSEDVYPAPEGEGEELPESVTIVKPKRLEGEIPVEISRENESIPYTFPDTSLLNRLSPSDSSTNPQKIQELAAKLVETLKSFNIEVKVREISIGPAITRFELQPTAGVRVNKITSLADDIALSLAATTVRIEAPIPGKAAIGIEIPNESVATVSAREVLESTEFTESKSKLSIALGRDIAGKCIVGDIAKMPHVLIAGATGSGKSVCINSLIASILYKASPNEVKLIMIDPKVVELSVYNGIPHLLIPVVTDPRKAAGSLNWAVQEMTTRYKFFADEGVRDLKGYNALMEKEGRPRLPQIVIIIDELADLMMVAPKDVETYICRLAQLARAAGMHLVIATQRPSVNVITGVIKANIPSRIAFAVSSYIDSRTILDTIGAEKLLGRGDMLYYPMGATKPTRVQGAFISDEEVEKLVEFVKKDSEVHYDEDVLEQLERAGEDQSDGADDEDAKEADALLPQAIEIVIDSGQASVSLVQRKLSVGYARAGRLVDQMEARGIVGPSEDSKPRRVLVTKAEYLAMMEGAGIGNASSESSVIPEADENAAFANTIPATFGDDTIPYDDNDDEDDGDIIMPPSDN